MVAGDDQEDEMKAITTRGEILTVVERWENQYRHTTDERKIEILRRLKELDLTSVDRSIVDQIIGNESWASIRCHECGEYVTSAVQLWEEPDYESSTAVICVLCLQKALAMSVLDSKDAASIPLQSPPTNP